MKISIIVAAARNMVIGRGNRIPWHLPADLRHFKKLTTGKVLIIGRRTHESIGRPLPRRHTVVLSTTETRIPGCDVAASREQALRLAREACVQMGCTEIMVAGGEQVYRLFIDDAETIYLSRIDVLVDGDSFFPEIDPAVWKTAAVESRTADDENPYSMQFVTLVRRR